MLISSNINIFHIPQNSFSEFLEITDSLQKTLSPAPTAVSSGITHFLFPGRIALQVVSSVIFINFV